MSNYNKNDIGWSISIIIILSILLTLIYISIQESNFADYIQQETAIHIISKTLHDLEKYNYKIPNCIIKEIMEVNQKTAINKALNQTFLSGLFISDNWDYLNYIEIPPKNKK